MARTWCKKHWTRWRTHGDPLVKKRSGYAPGTKRNLRSYVDEEHKRCSKCKLPKPLDEFYKDSRGGQGRMATCKLCHRDVNHSPAATARKATPEWRDGQNVQQKRRRKADPERFRDYSNRRRDQTGTGDLLFDEWVAVRDAYAVLDAEPGAVRCAYCGRSCFTDRPQHADDRLATEHMLPLARGGTHTAANVVPACRKCNAGKYNRTPEEWAELGNPLPDLSPHPYL
jgi:5-methylcytosine-specific restriction endonuclease McrA